LGLRKFEPQLQSDAFAELQEYRWVASGTATVKQTMVKGGDLLIVASADATEVSKLVVAAAELGRQTKILEAAHPSDAAFDAAVILPETVVLVGAGPAPNGPVQRGADCPWGGSVFVRGDLLGNDAGGRARRPKERLGRRHVAVLAQYSVHQSAGLVNGHNRGSGKGGNPGQYGPAAQSPPPSRSKRSTSHLPDCASKEWHLTRRNPGPPPCRHCHES
jgi:hypothetical protein